MSSEECPKKVSELSRQFGRSVDAQALSNNNKNPSPNRKPRILPKILSHISKNPPMEPEVAIVSKPESSNSEEEILSQQSSDYNEESAIQTEDSASEPDAGEVSTINNHKSSVNSTVIEVVYPSSKPPVQLRPTRNNSFSYQLHPANPSDRLVGLDHLQEQVQRLALRRGFTLNILVVGRSGMGKSTLINTLFRSSILPRFVQEPTDNTPPAKTTEIRTTQTVIQENGVKLELTVTDTPGFGDRINNTNCWDPVLQYINDQYEKYLDEEQSAHRTRWIRDTRVHCCLYFIPPSGHGLRPLDLEVLKRLHNVVNVIPVIAKADTLTLEEREEFRKSIQKDLMENGIEIYPLAKYEHIEDSELNQTYRKLTPFAVVGGEEIHHFKGRPVLGRQNGWGLVQVEDPTHCEFHLLKNLLIRNRMQDLIELTSAIHYEAFRRKRLVETLNGAIIDINSLNESHI